MKARHNPSSAAQSPTPVASLPTWKHHVPVNQSPRHPTAAAGFRLLALLSPILLLGLADGLAPGRLWLGHVSFSWSGRQPQQHPFGRKTLNSAGAFFRRRWRVLPSRSAWPPPNQPARFASLCLGGVGGDGRSGTGLWLCAPTRTPADRALTQARSLRWSIPR